MPRDTASPTTPVVSVTQVGSTRVSLAWTSTDDAPDLIYWVFKDGNPVIELTRQTSGTIYLLEPDTTYTFTVQARDNGGNWSPPSEPLMVNTEPTDPNDTTAPSTPANLREDHWAGENEIYLSWTQSVDDVDPQAIIRYDVYLNGVLDDITIGTGRSNVYVPAGFNTINVVAVDSGGNESTAATITFFFF
jgi:chitinase